MITSFSIESMIRIRAQRSLAVRDIQLGVDGSHPPAGSLISYIKTLFQVKRMQNIVPPKIRQAIHFVIGPVIHQLMQRIIILLYQFPP